MSNSQPGPDRIRRWLRLAHGWRLAPMDVAAAAVADFIRPAVRAVPGAICNRLPPCEISLPAELDGGAVASRWTITERALEIAVATRDVAPHDVALELLVCAGQSLWEVVSPTRRDAWIALLCTELAEGVAGEIDEQALDAKRRLLSSRALARARRRWDEYACASFAGTVAEYAHSLWHDVTVRTGAEHLPPRCLRRRLERMQRWFPPNRGYRLYP